MGNRRKIKNLGPILARYKENVESIMNVLAKTVDAYRRLRRIFRVESQSEQHAHRDPEDAPRSFINWTGNDLASLISLSNQIEKDQSNNMTETKMDLELLLSQTLSQGWINQSF